MKSSWVGIWAYQLVVLLLLLIPSGNLQAQTPSGTLRGRVTDPSGAVITKASVTAKDANGQATIAVTNNQGTFEINGLAPGTYTVTTTAKGFAADSEENVAIAAGQAQQLDIALQIAVKPEKIQVEENPATVDTSPSANATSIVIQGKDLEALSDDPDELQSELEALAGPSAGPNGGQIYIDGFTAGQLPPKSSIREIRVNQNPFSAEYDKLGYGRIEIFTKPGTDQYHGQILVDGNDSAFDALSPFASQQPPFYSEMFNGSIGGPLSKKASFFFDAQRRQINDSNIVNATILNPNNPGEFTQFTQAVPNPRTRTNLGPRLDYQLSQNNTLTVRYQFFQNNENNEGVGQFSLPSQAYNSSETEHTLQISDTQVLSTNVINETRFQYIRDHNSQAVQDFQPTVSVLGAFVGGGNQIGNLGDDENRYELQNYSSIVHGTHFIKFGGRLRASTDSNSSNTGFNGVFTFSSLNAYQTAPGGGNACIAPLIAALPTLPTAAALAACGASQFSIISGQPLSQVSLVDAGLYGSDDWRMRPNMTLSYGLRFETQNQIHDHGDFAPRLSFAWGLGGAGKNAAPKTVLRTGWGIFYDRFPSNFVLQAERLNGFTQQQAIVETTPNQKLPFSPTIYQIASNLQAPSTMQTAIGLERQVAKGATVAVTYLNSYGEHQLFIRNANAPDPITGLRPFGGTSNIYQYDSEGIFRQNQLIVNGRVSAGSKLSLFGFYTLNYANSDLGSGGGGGGGGVSANFLTHQYDPMADYGRSFFDVRHRVFLGGTISMPYAFRLSPFIIASSGQPFDITVGQDLNGDSIFNDRPALVSNASCRVVTMTANIACTPLGTFNLIPSPGQLAIPVNSGTGPALFTMNLRLSKSFGFGRETGGGTGGGPGGGYGGGHHGGPPGGGLGGRGLSGGGGPGGMFGMGPATSRRYNLTFSVSARNLLNRVNLAPPIGNLSSPLFDQSIALAGGPYSFGSASRRIDLLAQFSF
jgi:hypothetical protein